MNDSRRNFLKLVGTATAAAGLARLSQPSNVQAQNETALSIDDPILHLINRITWGVTPSELAYARTIGYEAYLNEQLNPETISDPEGDSIWEKRPIMSLDRSALYNFKGEKYRVYDTLINGTVELATRSRRQLQERMVDFWSDHFNILIAREEETTVFDGVSYLHDAIRPYALGKFRDLVFTTSKAPAMLRYLDNDSNIATRPNENYARELMELHTLGVDGGYTEQDVVEIARALTGWTVHNRTVDGFYFNSAVHDQGVKQILGHTLPAGRGIEDGLHALNILVNHPSTARFISHKLCVRFVSDSPDQSLIDSTTQIWIQSDGNIKSVLYHILTSQEFLQSSGQKFRRPLEFFVGVLRATNAQFHEDDYIREALTRLNHLPYNWAPPNGYPDTATSYLNTNSLLGRWNVALAITNEFDSVDPRFTIDLMADIGEPQTAEELVQAVGVRVFGMPLPATHTAPFIDYVSDGEGANTALTMDLRARKLTSLYGLMLASPLYQWR